MKERRHINKTGSHGLVILVVAISPLVPLLVQRIKHFLPRLHVHSCDVLSHVSYRRHDTFATTGTA